jgi:DNA polymerase alpha subunit B
LLGLQEEVTVVGRVACDAEDNKLTANSVVLVGATEKDEVPVNLKQVPDFALFPGQVVAMRTLNQSGSQLLPSKLFTNISPPESAVPITFQTEQGKKHS